MRSGSPALLERRARVGLLAALIACPAAPALATDPCAPAQGLSFLCGAIKPEDLKRIPGTAYLVASGFSPGSGLKLVDTRRKRFEHWFLARPDQVTPDRARYPDCAMPPDPALFNARGLSLRRTGRNMATLFVVNHGGRESVEVFTIRRGSAKAAPTLHWQGCLLMPEGHVGNAVASYRDGTVLVSVLTRPGKSITDFERGEKTGGIFERAPGAAHFTLIPGTELPGNNGLETARDDRGFYAVAFGLRAVALFKRGSQTGPEAIVPAPGFMPDNIHWNGKRLIAAGMNSDEPACGGPRQIINGIADTMQCPRGWRVAALDPRRRTFRILAQGERVPGFNGVSQALFMGRTLWLGSYQADRIAYQRR
jgi:hypothetical protein